jgi:4-diphosphocytidyl-2-C-methyl-D-erythritol kinase
VIELSAPGKVNLFLRILAREETGYHQLETLYCALELGDTLRMEPRGGGISLRVQGPPLGAVENNLVYRAAEGFFRESGVEEGVEIVLEKTLPPGGGLGGGSSDAAWTLRGLARLFPGALSEHQLLGLAGALGSDVPFFLSPSPLCLAWGRGERLLPLPPLPAASVVVAMPPLQVPTAEAYEMLARERVARRTRPGPGNLFLENLTSWESVARLAENDFETPVFRSHPVLGEIRMGLLEEGALFSLLSGSGAALFGVFPDPETASRGRGALARRFSASRFLLTRSAVTIPELPGSSRA